MLSLSKHEYVEAESSPPLVMLSLCHAELVEAWAWWPIILRQAQDDKVRLRHDKVRLGMRTACHAELVEAWAWWRIILRQAQDDKVGLSMTRMGFGVTR
jgi:hypothetical protein